MSDGVAHKVSSALMKPVSTGPSGVGSLFLSVAARQHRHRNNTQEAPDQGNPLLVIASHLLCQFPDKGFVGDRTVGQKHKRRKKGEAHVERRAHQ